MDEQTFWRLVAEYLAGLQTSGNQMNPGGDMPYDDFDLQGAIGAGPVMASGEPFDPMGDGSIGGLTGNPTMYDTSPSTTGYYSAPPERQAQPLGNRVAPMAANPMTSLFAAMQYGADNGAGGPLYGLFGNSPTISRPQPQYQVTPAAAPVAGPAYPAPQGTPTPNPLRDISTLPKIDEKERFAQPRTANQVVTNLSQPKGRQQGPSQAALNIAQAGQSGPMRQKMPSAPAATSRPAPTVAPVQSNPPPRNTAPQSTFTGVRTRQDTGGARNTVRSTSKRFTP